MPVPKNLALVVAQIEDQMVPLLRLWASEHALYYHLLRHTYLKGQLRLQISRRALARSAGVCVNSIYLQLRKLMHKGCVRILGRSLDGLVLELCLPDEIPICAGRRRTVNLRALESADCFRVERLRAAILRREGGKCFYCLRQLPPGAERFDHVVPARAGGDNSYRNIAACCFDCNSHKGAQPARDLLRSLYRSGRLSSKEFDARLAALRALSAGKLKPQLSL